MIENHPSGVLAAVDILVEEVETEIEFINRVGSRAFESRDYERAKEALERAGEITAFRDRVDMLRREWKTLARQLDAEEGSDAHGERRNFGRLRRGVRTREEAYYRPILQALDSLGGSAPMAEALTRVQKLMQGTLQNVDLVPLASDPDMPRWKNAAQWARHSMMKDGLLSGDSPRGVWEMTDAGRRFLLGS